MHSSMVGFISFNSGISSVASDWNISLSVQLQFLYSHSKECTEIIWESLTSIVISLTLVNGIHQWPIIKWFLSCLTSRNLFAWLESYRLGLEWRPWVVCYSLEYVHILRFRWSTIRSYDMDPHIIFGGYVQYWVCITWIYFVAMFCLQSYWS